MVGDATLESSNNTGSLAAAEPGAAAGLQPLVGTWLQSEAPEEDPEGLPSDMDLCKTLDSWGSCKTLYVFVGFRALAFQTTRMSSSLLTLTT